MRAPILPSVFRAAVAIAARNPALQAFSAEHIRRMVIPPRMPGSGFVRGRAHPWKAHTYRRSSGPGSYDYEAKLEVYNRRRRRAGLPVYANLKTAVAEMGAIA